MENTSSSSSFTLDLFGPKDNSSSPSSPGLFGSVFGPPSTVLFHFHNQFSLHSMILILFLPWIWVLGRILLTLGPWSVRESRISEGNMAGAKMELQKTRLIEAKVRVMATPAKTRGPIPIRMKQQNHAISAHQYTMVAKKFIPQLASPLFLSILSRKMGEMKIQMEVT